MITLTDCIFRPYPGMIFVLLIPSLSIFIFMLCFIKKMKKKTHTHIITIYGTKYSRMYRVKLVEDSLWKLLIWFADHITSYFLKAIFHRFYLVHSWILCPISLLPLTHINFWKKDIKVSEKVKDFQQFLVSFWMN